MSLAADLRTAKGSLAGIEEEWATQEETTQELEDALSIMRAQIAMQTPKLERQKLCVTRANERLREAATIEATLRQKIESLRSGGVVALDEW
jgi:chromosome segregation ATPase|tara:strand:+ start:763 stop:1038 length:276 start_codon:yes stop_codon:yes gene_type:complete